MIFGVQGWSIQTETITVTADPVKYYMKETYTQDNLTRNSCINGNLSVISKGTYYSADLTLKKWDDTILTNLNAMNGTQVTFYPHADNARNFECTINEVCIKGTGRESELLITVESIGYILTGNNPYDIKLSINGVDRSNYIVTCGEVNTILHDGELNLMHRPLKITIDDTIPTVPAVNDTIKIYDAANCYFLGYIKDFELNEDKNQYDCNIWHNIYKMTDYMIMPNGEDSPAGLIVDISNTMLGLGQASPAYLDYSGSANYMDDSGVWTEYQDGIAAGTRYIFRVLPLLETIGGYCGISTVDFTDIEDTVVSGAVCLKHAMCSQRMLLSYGMSDPSGLGANNTNTLFDLFMDLSKQLGIYYITEDPTTPILKAKVLSTDIYTLDNDLIYSRITGNKIKGINLNLTKHVYVDPNAGDIALLAPYWFDPEQNIPKYYEEKTIPVTSGTAPFVEMDIGSHCTVFFALGHADIIYNGNTVSAACYYNTLSPFIASWIGKTPKTYKTDLVNTSFGILQNTISFKDLQSTIKQLEA